MKAIIQIKTDVETIKHKLQKESFILSVFFISFIVLYLFYILIIFFEIASFLESKKNFSYIMFPPACRDFKNMNITSQEFYDMCEISMKILDSDENQITCDEKNSLSIYYDIFTKKIKQN